MEKTENAVPAPCAIAAAERRLQDAANFWQRAYEDYFAPGEFRINLQAAIQSLRSVTFVLQAQKATLPGFDSWYEKQQTAMRQDPKMRWLVDARNFIEKQGDLTTRSRFTVTLSWAGRDQPAQEIPLPVETSAAEVAKIIGQAIPAGLVDEESLMRLERHWVDSLLPEEEVLTTLIHCYSRLRDVLFFAHELLAESANERCPFYHGLKSTNEVLPAPMLAGEFPRTVWFKLKKGVLAGYDTKSETVSRKEVEQKVAERYPGLSEAFVGLTPTAKFRDTCLAFFQAAKLFLQRDGYHVPMAIVGTAQAPLFFQFQMHDRADKHIMMREIASRCARAKALWCLFIAEAWTAPVQGRNRYAADDPQRGEILVLHAVHADGSSLVCSAGFSRIDGKIVLGAETVAENAPPDLMQPIFTVLRKNKP